MKGEIGLRPPPQSNCRDLKELAAKGYVVTAKSPALPWFGAIAYHGFP
jgi:hypothetical protein